MNKKIKILIITTVIVLISIIGIFYGIQSYLASKMQGKLVFEASYDNGKDINRIVITSQGGVVNLKQKNGHWHVSDYNDYYANFEHIKSFLDTINSSNYIAFISSDKNKIKSFYLSDPRKDKETSGILIQTFIDNKEIDSVIVGFKNKEKNYFIARQSDSPSIWLISGNYDIPTVAKEWLPSYIIKFSEDMVSSIYIDEKSISRRMTMENFQDRLGINVNADWLLHTLTSLEARDIMHETDFHQKFSQVKPSKVYRINTFYGLIIELSLFNVDNQDVWGYINLLTDNLVHNQVRDYIRDNNFLYNGWYFKLSSLQKVFLMNYRLL
jgi:hypothetical protein